VPNGSGETACTKGNRFDDRAVGRQILRVGRMNNLALSFLFKMASG
jgi:hypothetical protein